MGSKSKKVQEPVEEVEESDAEMNSEEELESGSEMPSGDEELESGSELPSGDEFDDDNAEWLKAKKGDAEADELLSDDDEVSDNEELDSDSDDGDLEKMAKKLDRKRAEDERLAEEQVDANIVMSEDEEEEDEEAPKEKLLASGRDLKSLKASIEADVTLLSSWGISKKADRKGRDRTQVLEDLQKALAEYYGYSEELASYWLKMLQPEECIEFMEANDKPRPVTLRTNTLKSRRKALQQSLVSRGAVVEPIGEWTKVGLKVLDSQVPVGATPEYLAGQYMIQSASSFVPVMALAPQMNEKILDMAAAPGGKTTYIGQLMQNTGVLFANDLKKERCKSLAANIQRLGLTNSIVINEDGLNLGKHLPQMDRILLDAPCTGSGIISRDQSIKMKRTVGDFRQLSDLQKQLLRTAVDLIDHKSKTGGYLVYSTCSLAVEENEMVIDYILKARDVKLVPFDDNVKIGRPGFVNFRENRFDPAMKHTRRFYPHAHNMDGFFVAKLKKISAKIPERPQKDRRKEGEVVWGEDKWTDDVMDGVVEFEHQESTSNKKKKREARDVRQKEDEEKAKKDAVKAKLAEERKSKRSSKKVEKMKARRDVIKMKEKARLVSRKEKRKAAMEAFKRGEGPKPPSKKEAKEHWNAKHSKQGKEAKKKEQETAQKEEKKTNDKKSSEDIKLKKLMQKVKKVKKTEKVKKTKKATSQ